MPDSISSQSPLKRVGIVVAILAVMVVAFLGAIVVAGFWRFSSPALTRQVESVLSRQLQATCSMAHFRVVPFRGASCDSLRFVKILPGQRVLTVNSRRANISYRPAAILMKLPSVLHLGAEEASSRLWSSRTSGTANAVPSFSERMTSFSRSLAGTVLRSAVITDATLRITGPSGELVWAQGITVRASVPVQSVAEIVTETEIDSVTLKSTWRLASVSTVASVNGGSLRVVKASAQCYGGKIAGRGGLDLDRSRLDSLTLHASRIDVGALYALARGQGTLAGAAQADIKFAPSALKLDSLQGRGDLSITDFSVSDHPIQRLLLDNLLLPSVDHLTFGKVTSRISLEERTLYAADLKAKGDPLSVASNGYAGLDGRIDFAVEGTLTKGFVSSLPPVVRDALIPARNGGASFACRFYGSINSPAVSIDKSHIDRAVNSVLKSLSQELKRLMR